jgi:DNA-binding ferritin-like protein
VAERLRTLGAIPIGGAPEVLAQHLTSEQARYRDVTTRANIKPE